MGDIGGQQQPGNEEEDKKTEPDRTGPDEEKTDLLVDAFFVVGISDGSERAVLGGREEFDLLDLVPEDDAEDGMSAFMDDSADRCEVNKGFHGNCAGDPGPHETGTELGQSKQDNAWQKDDPEEDAGLKEGIQNVGNDFHGCVWILSEVNDS